MTGCPDLGPINTHDVLMPNGKHKGERVTRLPISYLKWMVRERHGMADVAEAELARRGTTTPEIEISGHAIDSASLRIRKTWHESRGEDEGLHAWLCRMVVEAVEKGEKRGDKIAYAGVLWVVGLDGAWPVLKTVMRDKKAG